MKLGISINRKKDLPRYGNDYYRLLKSCGYECIDYGTDNTDDILYTMPEQELMRHLAEEKVLIAEAGMEVHQVHGPWRHPMQDTTPEDRAERLEKMEKSICMAEMLGAKNWIIHPIFPFGPFDAGTEDAKRTWDLNLTFMHKLLAIAKAHDVTICFENMPFLDFSLSRPEDILRFVKTMNDDHFKICLDTGHVNVFEDLSIGDSVRLMGDEIRALHIHDNKWSHDLHLMPYFGSINWAEFTQALKDINYQGVFSLETEPPAAVPPPVYEALLKSMADIAKHIMP
ncbi:MAG: sugar phosphate isomerase/epimerase [Clostridia bacterium]|nr:sugar phosphate isomerase/epimerase [Clostridia bacterium]